MIDNIKRMAAVMTAKTVLAPLQKDLDEMYKTMLIAINSLGFSEKETVDIIQDAMQSNAEVLKNKKMIVSDETKEELERIRIELSEII